MFDYTGYECRSCGEKFAGGDDIVICPECGTPYHRECYKREGACTNTRLHESRVSWKEDTVHEEEAPKCRSCGSVLKEDQLFCDKCGNPTEFFFKSAARANAEPTGSSTGSTETARSVYPYLINFTDPLCGFNPDEPFEEGMTAKDMGDFVGTNTHYYLPKFRNMKVLGLKLSLNLPAMIFPEIYFANRKMPFAAALVLILRTILGFPEVTASMKTMLSTEIYKAMFMQNFPQLAETIEKVVSLDLEGKLFSSLHSVTSMLNIIVVFVFAGFSNYFYYKHVIAKGAKIKQSAVSAGRDPSMALRQCGGTSSGLMILFILLYIIMQYISMAAVFMLV